MSYLSTLLVDNDRASISFSNTDSQGHDKPTVTFHLPPAAPGPNPINNSCLIPPLHFHPTQSETFHVLSGSLRVLHNGKPHIVTPDASITVAPGDYHTFTNASAEHGLTLEIWKHPEDWAQEEKFFRNLAGVLRDTVEPGQPMLSADRGFGVFQIMLIAWEADAIVCEPGK